MSVEFLPGDEPGDVGDAPSGATRRTHRRLWLVGAVVLAAAVAVWTVTRPVAPTRSASAHPACRGVPACAVHSDVPPAIGRLARAYLPPGMRLRVQTVVATLASTRTDVLLERDIKAVVDSVTVLIRVQRGGRGTQVITPDPPGVGSVLLHQLNSGFVVRLQYLAPETVPPMLGRLQALIRDPRLASA